VARLPRTRSFRSYHHSVIEELQLAEPSHRPAPSRSAKHRRRARLGPASLWLLLAAGLLQAFSLVQQFSYLFAPKPGEFPLLVAVVILASLVGFVGVVCGILGATTADGRRTGVFGAALGLAFLVLFAAATSFGWGFLDALSTPA
jgi:putative copper export protein